MATHTPPAQSSASAPANSLAHESTYHYRDTQMQQAAKAVRKAIRGNPEAERAFARYEARRRYEERCITAHDTQNAACAEQALAAGNYERASTFATLIWHTDTQIALYGEAQRLKRRAPVAPDIAAERIAEAIANGREVIV